MPAMIFLNDNKYYSLNKSKLFYIFFLMRDFLSENYPSIEQIIYECIDCGDDTVDLEHLNEKEYMIVYHVLKNIYEEGKEAGFLRENHPTSYESVLSVMEEILSFLEEDERFGALS